MYPQDALPEPIADINGIKLYPRAYEENYVNYSASMVLRGRIDGYLMTLLAGKLSLTENKLDHIMTVVDCVNEQKIYLAFTPSNKREQEVDRLVTQFEAGIKVLKEQRIMDSLLEKYGLSD